MAGPAGASWRNRLVPLSKLPCEAVADLVGAALTPAVGVKVAAGVGAVDGVAGLAIAVTGAVGDAAGREGLGEPELAWGITCALLAVDEAAGTTVGELVIVTDGDADGDGLSVGVGGGGVPPPPPPDDRGVTEEEGTDSAELPATFVACTVNVYAVPLERPDTVHVVAAAEHGDDAGVDVTV